MSTESHFLDWSEREACAERMVPLVGVLYRQHSVLTTIYGKPLHKKNPIEIIKAHKYAQKFDGAQAINMAESEAVLRRMVELNLAPARVDERRDHDQIHGVDLGVTSDCLSRAADADKAGNDPRFNRDGTWFCKPRQSTPAAALRGRV